MLRSRAVAAGFAAVSSAWVVAALTWKSYELLPAMRPVFYAAMVVVGAVVLLSRRRATYGDAGVAAATACVAVLLIAGLMLALGSRAPVEPLAFALESAIGLAMATACWLALVAVGRRHQAN